MSYSKSNEPKVEISPELVKRGEDLSLCFWLGMLMPVYGIVIAAIIAKADGVRASLKGAALLAVVMLLAVLLFGITSIES